MNVVDFFIIYLVLLFPMSIESNLELGSFPFISSESKKGNLLEQLPSYSRRGRRRFWGSRRMTRIGGLGLISFPGLGSLQ